MDETTTEESIALFNQGFESVVLPHIERIDKQLDRLETEMKRVEERLERVETRLEQLDRKVDRIAAKQLDQDRRLDAIEAVPAVAHELKRWHFFMYKTEVIRKVARETKLSQRVVTDALNATFRAIEQALQSGERVTFPGFGTFYKKQRPAGMIKSFATGLMVDVPAMPQVGFRVGEVLKRSVRPIPRRPVRRNS
jgi:DNA-binding protein HU-beta